MFCHVTINLSPANVRHDRMEGRDYLVAPMVMLTEGVHSGSQGPLYYPPEELAKTPVVWNMKPVVVYHPTINGKGISACDPEVVDQYKIGVVMNTKWDQDAKKLRAEAWIEVERANTVDARIMQAIENGTPMELSTGVFTDNEEVEGTWNGEDYVAIARNYRPDHLALLPDKIGACSMSDGAGFMICNALAHDDIRASLYASLRERFGSNVWIADVFATSVVYENEGKLWKLMYSTTNDVAVLGAEAPTQVRRNVQYRTIEGALIGNGEFPSNYKTGDVHVTKKELVDSLIANAATNWEEDDRKGLMGLSEDQLKKMVPPKVDADPTDPNPTDNKQKVADAAKKGAAEIEPTQNSESKKITLDQLPPDVVAVYNHGLRDIQQKRERMIKQITDNANNPFSAEQLNAMAFDQLQGIAALAVPPAPAKEPIGNQAPPMFFGGASGGPPAVTNEDDEEPLGLPTMNFGPETVKT